MRLRLCALLAAVGCGLFALAAPPPPADARPAAFHPPELFLDGSALGDVLFPHYADFDGDGTTDQLVGVGDRLLVYLNRGSDARPAYADPTWFDAALPSARIPGG